MFDLIKQLTEVYGPSGFEDRIREMIRDEIETFADEISVDAMGNLIVLKKGSGKAKDRQKVMIAAHMDEIGVMVSHITEDGFLRFANIGGVGARGLQGARVQFENGTVGVIYGDQLSDRSKVQPLSNHYIDVGATGQADCPVRVGDAAGFLQTAVQQGKRVFGKAIDDRIGCVIAIEALKSLKKKKSPHDVYFVFSVQEEVGVRGAATAANGILPDVGIALDVTLTGDMHKGVEMAVALGDGAAIKAKDSGMIAHVGLVNLMKKRAKDAKIPHQIEVLAAGSTDARSMQLAGTGSAAGCISIPCRYVHSTSETVDLGDVQACIDLLVEMLTSEIDL